MQSLGTQLVNILNRKAKKMDIAENKVAVLIRDEMLLNTKSGKGFGNDEYNNEYSPDYAKRKKGGKTSPVTLRDEEFSIEQTRISNASKKTKIEFENSEKAYIFRLHHEGRAKGGKTRSIFPKSMASVTMDIHLEAVKEVKDVLNGL